MPWAFVVSARLVIQMLAIDMHLHCLFGIGVDTIKKLRDFGQCLEVLVATQLFCQLQGHRRQHGWALLGLAKQAPGAKSTRALIHTKKPLQ